MKKEAKQELERIRKENGGRLLPAHVVRFAKNPRTHLHQYFEWDDGEAAEQFRLQQARQIIKVVVVINEQTSEPVRAYVSLKSDRQPKQGYRAFTEVVDDDALLRELIEDAKDDLAAFARRYERLKAIGDLSGLFTEIEKVTATRRNKRSVKEDRATA